MTHLVNNNTDGKTMDLYIYKLSKVKELGYGDQISLRSKNKFLPFLQAVWQRTFTVNKCWEQESEYSTGISPRVQMYPWLSWVLFERNCRTLDFIAINLTVNLWKYMISTNTSYCILKRHRHEARHEHKSSNSILFSFLMSIMISMVFFSPKFKCHWSYYKQDISSLFL